MTFLKKKSRQCLQFLYYFSIWYLCMKIYCTILDYFTVVMNSSNKFLTPYFKQLGQVPTLVKFPCKLLQIRVTLLTNRQTVKTLYCSNAGEKPSWILISSTSPRMMAGNLALWNKTTCNWKRHQPACLHQHLIKYSVLRLFPTWL